MNQVSAGMDPLLLPFLNTADGFDSEHLLAELISEYAEPVIYRILKTKLHVSLRPDLGSKENQDALDIAGNLRAILITELRELQASSTQKTIASFPDYVAVKTFSACADYFRQKNPQRSRLKNLIRRHLKQDPRFDLWKGSDNHWYAGLRSWNETIVKPEVASAEYHLEQTSHTVPALREEGLSDGSLVHLLSEIFAGAGQALPFDRVVAIAAERWDVRDLPDESVEDAQIGRTLLDLAPRIDLALEQRLYLENLWTEVCQLPMLQRMALLLNLRDVQGGSVICYIPYLGIASLAEIAALVGLPIEQFDQIWLRLPLDDSSLAALMKLTRQQIINLRKTARERLARRMKKLEETGKEAGESGKKRV